MSERIRVDDLEFDVKTAGDRGAPLILMLHGFPHSSHSWRSQLPALANAGFFAVAPDQRGYSAGARPAGVASYTADLLVADALDIAAALGYESFHVVGHDWGGHLSWLLGALHGARVSSVTVLSRPHPAAFAAALEEDAAQAGRSGHHRAFLDPAATDRLLSNDAARLRAMLRDLDVPDEDATEYLRVLTDHDTLDAALNWYRAAAPPHLRRKARDVPDVAVPTLYMWGDRDSTVGARAAELSVEHLTGPHRFEVLAGVGHSIPDQVPEVVNRLLLDFLRDPTAQGSASDG